MLAARDIAYPLRKIAAEFDGFEAHRREVASVDPVARSPSRRSAATRYTGDYLVLAAGSQPNFFKTPGAEHAFPLYSLDDAERLRTRIIEAFEEADREPTRRRRGRHRLRHRRRRPDRRRGGRRPVRDDQHDDGRTSSRRWPRGARSTWSTTARRCSRCSPTRPTPTRRRSSRRTAWSSGWARASPRSARAT